MDDATWRRQAASSSDVPVSLVSSFTKRLQRQGKVLWGITAQISLCKILQRLKLLASNPQFLASLLIKTMILQPLPGHRDNVRDSGSKTMRSKNPLILSTSS